MTDCTVLRTNSVNTRKPHKCTGCFDVFPSNSFMHRWVGLVEGDFQSNYFCSNCQMFLDSKAFDRDEGFYAGEIYYLKREAAPEMFGDEEE